MGFALPREATNSVAEIIHRLEMARGRPDNALRAAVAHADEIAPAVVELTEKAADGVYLLPRQSNLFFWGLHAVAAARRTELCRPLLRLVRTERHDYLNDLFGDGITECLKRVLLSVFDGDTGELLAACADREVDGFVRWGLMEALARLTFDGAVTREATLAFLDRFERESLAEPEDVAWEGWQEAVVFLGFEELHERMRGVWSDGRAPEGIADRDFWERQIATVRAMAPGDPALFVRENLAPITDPVDALRWASTEQEIEAREAARPMSRARDPAAATALDGGEIAWLEGFLLSKHVPETAMTLEQIDGYFSALAACPRAVSRDEYWAGLWNYDAETDAEPDYESEEQAEYVEALLGRHMAAIVQRLEYGQPSAPILTDPYGKSAGARWAAGFMRGVAARAQDWGSRAGTEDVDMLLGGLVGLGTGHTKDGGNTFTPKLRSAFIEVIPNALLAIHHAWRGRDLSGDEVRSPRRAGRKIGRNEPCPCGSGKKYKRCCGAPTGAQ